MDLVTCTIEYLTSVPFEVSACNDSDALVELQPGSNVLELLVFHIDVAICTVKMHFFAV